MPKEQIVRFVCDLCNETTKELTNPHNQEYPALWTVVTIKLKQPMTDAIKKYLCESCVLEIESERRNRLVSSKFKNSGEGT